MENSTEVKVESVKAINPTAIEVTFNNAPKELTTKDIKVGDLDVKKVELDGKKAIVTVSGAKYDTAYDVVYGDQKNTVKFGKVAEYFTLKIESDAKDTNNNSIADIEASGATTTQLTAYIVDYKGDVVTDYDGKFEFLTTNGSLAQTEVVIQKGKASVQLRSVSSLETIYADVTAKVVTGNELSGLVGNTTIEFAPKQATGEAQTAVPVVKAQTETADRVQVVLGQPKKLTEKELLAVKTAATVTDTVLKREVDVKEVRQINDTILELVLDTYSQPTKDTYNAVNYLTDNAEHTVSFDAIPKVLVETAKNNPLKFKLTDGTKQVALGATGVNQRTIEVRFNDPVAVKGEPGKVTTEATKTWNALDPANYVLDGKALKDSKIDLKRDEKGNIVGEGRIVEIKLSQDESIKKEQTVLQVRNVGDWAAVTDVKNQIATQDLFLTTNIDQTKPAMVAKTESPEQFRLVFNQPVKASSKDLKSLIDVRYGEALTKEAAESTTDAPKFNAVKPAEGDLTNLLSKDGVTNTGAGAAGAKGNKTVVFSALTVDPKTGIRTVVKTDELDADAIIEEILVELTDDWTTILGAEAYWTAAPQIQFKVKRNAFATAMDNKNIAVDVVADNSVYDTKSPVASAKQNKTLRVDTNGKTVDANGNVTTDKSKYVYDLNEYLDITFDEPVQISELTKQGTNVPNTPNAKQTTQTQKTDVEFSKNGVVVKGEIYDAKVGDFNFKLQAKENAKEGFAALEAAIDKKNADLAADKKLSAAGTWTVKVTGVSDDYGNTMAAQTFNFEVPGEAVAPKVPLAIDPFVVYANLKQEKGQPDVITVKYSEVMANAGADGVGLVTNYWVNSGQLTADAGAKIEKGITGVTEDWDGVTITLPEGTVQKEDFMLTVASNLKSADGQTLTRDNKLNLKTEGKNDQFTSSYLPGLLFVNEFDTNAYDVLAKESKITEAITKAIVTAGAATIAGANEDGFATQVEATVTFSNVADLAKLTTETLQVEINGVVGVGTVSGQDVTVVIKDEDKETAVQDLELEKDSPIEVKINGQTMFVKAAAKQ